MNPETLKKCLSGDASEEEWSAYEQWLEGEDDANEDLSEIAVTEGTDTRIWKQIEGQNQQQDRSRIKRLRAVWISAAASLVLIGSFILFSSKQAIPNQKIVFQSDHSLPLPEREFEGLRMKLGANSKVKLQRQQDNDINIQLSGNVMLSNTSAQDKYTQVSYTTSDGHQMSRKICLKKGQKYLFAYYPLKEDKLLVIENNALMDMPPALVMNLKNDFDLL
ncbi:hypothetical protein [Pedobacter steynii]|uniref:Uncharacterized protein n=1 Tax=Pedobacter steynii TaxID=430522 RepID=A0A1D7QCY7_9SPHI|nr:hypothetical protein [Pedobacter steynii]AOM76505.1 hypothetical protein BFS30_04655 [Pedobacter steynii]